MKLPKPTSEDLRTPAERLLEREMQTGRDIPARDVLRLLQELHVHQEELERQNKELRDAQLALNHASDRYKQLFDLAPIPYLLIQADGLIIQANHAAAQLLGQARPGLEKRVRFGVFVLPESQSDWQRLQHEMETSPIRQQVELAIQGVDAPGRTVLADAMPRTFDAGEGWYTLIALIDITELRGSQLALRNTEEKVRMLLGATTQATWEADANGLVRKDSPSWRSYTGQSVEEWLGDGWLRAVHPDDRAALRQRWGEIVREGHPAEAQFRVRRADGQWRWTNALVAPLHDRQGAIMSWVGMNVDITTQKELEQRLEGLNEELEDLVRKRTAELAQMLKYSDQQRDELHRLAGELSESSARERQRIASELHDGLSQLLTTCVIHLDAVQDLALPPEANHKIARVTGILERVLREMRVLIFGLSSPVLDTLGLPAALQELCEEYQQVSEVRFRYQGMREPAPVTPECQSMLYRSARELMFNAVRHAHPQEVVVRLSATEYSLALTVEDDGSGCPDHEAGTRFSATGGYGLFWTRENAHRAGGRFRIASAPGHGTQVTMEVPIGEGTTGP